jgi:pimeloyl-ACP methyl ester carboxylesterase
VNVVLLQGSRVFVGVHNFEFDDCCNVLNFVKGGPGDAPLPEMDETGTTLALVGNQQATVYIPDPRGVANSTALICSPWKTFADLSACGDQLVQAWGAKFVMEFKTENTAYDTSLLIQAVKEDYVGVPVAVYGVSYGTLLLQKVLVYYPDSFVDVAIMDGVVSQSLNIMGNENV